MDKEKVIKCLTAEFKDLNISSPESLASVAYLALEIEKLKEKGVDVSKEELKMSKDIKNISFSTSIEGGYDDKGNLTGNRIKVLWMHFKGENKESMLNLNNLISESSITIDEAMKEAIMSNFKEETSEYVPKPKLPEEWKEFFVDSETDKNSFSLGHIMQTQNDIIDYLRKIK